MIGLVELILVLLVAASVYLWPLAAILAILMLQAPGNNWNFISYLFILSLIAYVPLIDIARKRRKYAGPFVTRAELVRIAAPAIANMVLLSSLVVYLALVCNWRFSCGS